MGYLENYKHLCETRLRELAPSHPLPINISHLGCQNPDAEEIKARMRNE